MIVTLTANPSIDRTFEVSELEWGGVTRAVATRVHPGGKGVNVARALVGNGVTAKAVIPVGGHEGQQLLDLLSALTIEVEPVRIADAIRENIAVVEPDGRVTKVNAAGPTLTDEEIHALVTTTVKAGIGADWVVLCGALPPGAPNDLYARLVLRLHEQGVRVAVDSSGPALVAALDAGPDLIKPNEDELAEAVGRPIETIEDAARAARELVERGAGSVLVSLGIRGALLIDGNDDAHASTEPVVPRSTVGAGDAALAGYLASGGEPHDRLRTAVAWGAASVRLPGTGTPTPEHIHLHDVTIEPLAVGSALD